MGLKWVNICFTWWPEFLCKDGALQQMHKHCCGNHSAHSFFLASLNSFRVHDKAENILLLKVHLFLQSVVIGAYCTDSFSLNQDFDAEMNKVVTFLSDYM